ncbi:alpha/beta fold hydrolase [Nocardia sp. 348MFTsu5.1]|uniref:alpha/beta fold hydrolase n=1 Tax=Nocardia sp. 348MFTsu5.1 TaxID=1172185 RepID=UPI000372CBE0|nr:alpha/beta hydrolase [Nocardia sp. 348MFTsu5.1]
MSAHPHEALDAESLGEVVVRGVPVRFSVVGRGDRDVLLVHGSGAHRWWWHLLIPQLVAAGLRVTSFDLSGHGDSGHRSEYGAEVWGEEILAVMAATGSSRPVVVGHSLGGRLTLITAGAHPDAFAALVLIDTPLRPPPSYRAAVAAGRGQRARQERRYSREEAMARFRLVPPQPHPAAEVMHALAVNGVREVEGMWTWKHDQCMMPAFYGPELLAAAARVRIPLCYVYGGCSALVKDDEADFVRSHVAGEVKVVRIADGFHHLSLDRPTECAAAIISTRSRA